MMTSLVGRCDSGDYTPSPLWLPNSHLLACPQKLLGKSEVSQETKDNRVSGLPPWPPLAPSLGVHCVQSMRNHGEQSRGKGRRAEKALGWSWSSPALEFHPLRH